MEAAAVAETTEGVRSTAPFEYELGRDGRWRADFDALDAYAGRRRYIVKFRGPLEVRLEQGVRAGLGTTGADIWDAAVVLARVLEAGAVLLEGRTVLELGCGVGLASHAAAALGAARVLATDLDQPFLRLLWGANLAANAAVLGGRLRFACLDWSRPAAPVLNAWLGAPDIVLASDVVYEDGHAQLLVATMLSVREFAAANRQGCSITALVAAEAGSRRGWPLFLDLARKNFSRVERMDLSTLLLPEWVHPSIVLFKISML